MPTFPCVVEGCTRKAGVKGNKCYPCKSRAMSKAPTLTEEQKAERYLNSIDTKRQKLPRRAKH